MVCVIVCFGAMLIALGKGRTWRFSLYRGQ